MRARVRRFLFFAFTSSPVCRNLLCHSSIGVKVFRIEVHSRGEDKKVGRCSPQNACRSGEKVGQVKGEEEKRKLAEARVSRVRAQEVASPSPPWGIAARSRNRKRGTNRAIRPAFLSRSGVFSFPCGKAVGGSVFTPVRRRANIPDRGNRCTGISAHGVRAPVCRAVHAVRRCSAFGAQK